MMDKQTRHIYDAQWRAKNREKIRQQSRDFYHRHKEQEQLRNRIKNKKMRMENLEHYRELDKQRSRSNRGIFCIYKKNASKRALLFDLSFELFETLIDGACAYCGISPSRGVDRIVNSNGYDHDNVCGCCKKCNHMKRDWSREDFIAHCKRVVDYSRSSK